jgi:two-component system NtrC family sensor kinase
MPDAERVVISIADTGIGISDEHMQHLFEPFYTTKPQGTGLGLAISAHIVTQHAGQITVDSAPHVGTTFTITLPVSPPLPPEIEP